MRITKVINNNTVVTVLSDRQEAILTGSGIGFRKKVGDIVSPQVIEKTYCLRGEKADQYERLFNKIPPVYFEIAEKVMKKAEYDLKLKLSSQLIFALTDHMYFSVERQRRGDMMPNLMLQEVRLLYSEEFQIGLYGKQLLEEKTQCKLPMDEAGYIALHIVNSQVQDSSISVNNVVVFTNGILNIISEAFHGRVDENSFFYNRFISHLKFLATRVFKQERLEMGAIKNMYPILLGKDQRLEGVITKIGNFVQDTFDYQLSVEEETYLLIHIIKIENL